MQAMAEFKLVPIGVGVSLSKYVAACEEIFREHGLKHELHAMGTNVEGELSELAEVYLECIYKLHQMGAIRVSASMSTSSRTDRQQTMGEKIKSVENKLKK